MEAFRVVYGQQRIDFGEDDKSDPKRYRTCERRGCGTRFRRARPSHEARGEGRYCSNACRALDFWDERREARWSGPIEKGQGRPARRREKRNVNGSGA